MQFPGACLVQMAAHADCLHRVCFSRSSTEACQCLFRCWEMHHARSFVHHILMRKACIAAVQPDRHPTDELSSSLTADLSDAGFCDGPHFRISCPGVMDAGTAVQCEAECALSSSMFSMQCPRRTIRSGYCGQRASASEFLFPIRFQQTDHGMTNGFFFCLAWKEQHLPIPGKASESWPRMRGPCRDPYPPERGVRPAHRSAVHDRCQAAVP